MPDEITPNPQEDPVYVLTLRSQAWKVDPNRSVAAIAVLEDVKQSVGAVVLNVLLVAPIFATLPFIYEWLVVPSPLYQRTMGIRPGPQDWDHAAMLALFLTFFVPPLFLFALMAGRGPYRCWRVLETAVGISWRTGTDTGFKLVDRSSCYIAEASCRHPETDQPTTVSFLAHDDVPLAAWLLLESNFPPPPRLRSRFHKFLFRVTELWFGSRLPIQPRDRIGPVTELFESLERRRLEPTVNLSWHRQLVRARLIP